MLLSALGLPQRETPPFASAVFFELWNSEGNQYVKLLYNDKELDLYKFCHGESAVNGTNRCEYELFQKRILENTFESMKEECAVPIK
jgi:hypothetical protein